MKRIIFIISCLLAAGSIYAGVIRKADVGGRLQDSYQLKPGDRVIVIEAGYTRATVTVKPAGKKIFDYRVPKDKVYNGMLILN